ncbi:MAG: sulfur transferase domain-containing protein [Pseudomonadota bacterium]
MSSQPDQAPVDTAREKRLNRWQRPLVTWWDRVAAWTNSLLVDHAFIRAVYLNRHKISSRAWRSAQPLPHQLRDFARQGVKTVVSLRGGQTFGSLPLEKEACEQNGLTFINFVMRSRSIPSAEDIHAADRLFREIDYPVLFHCKSGADRAGFMAVLFLVLAEGRSVAEARRQLSLKYGHIKEGKTGVLDAFWDAYERDTGGKTPLLDWVDTRYDRDAVQAGFEPTGWGSLIADRLLRRE